MQHLLRKPPSPSEHSPQLSPFPVFYSVGRTLLLAGALTLGHAVFAQEDEQENTNAEESSQQASAPFEVIVNPTLNIGDLEKLITQAEDDMFAKYNELNLDDDYDILCRDIKPTGSHISVRSCEPVFLDKARADNHGLFMFMLSRGGGVELLDDRTLQKNHRREYEELEKKMEAFTGTDAEFRALAQRVLDLRATLRER